MATGFKLPQTGGYSVDLDDLLMRREYLSDGTLWTCGYNSNGQLGDNTISDRSSLGNTAGGGTTWKTVACGYAHSAAIKTDGTLWTWGLNFNGQLGDNSTTSRSSPVTTVGGGTTWKTVACGNTHSAAIKTDGTLWAWGSNGFGQLFDNSTISRSSPVNTVGGGSTWKIVACGNTHSAAIKTDGTLWTSGYNLYGQLGDNSNTNRSSPVTTAGGGTTWKTVACGYAHSAAIKTDGTLWTWGLNFNGQLGDNSTTSRISPVTTVGGGTIWKTVACGDKHSAAIKTDGTLWTWGSNSIGQLGDNSTTSRSSPVTTIGGGTTWKTVACGYAHSAAIKTDGTLWTWGNNDFGKLGDNSTTSRSSPVTTAGGGIAWKTVALGTSHSMATTDLSF